MFERFSQDARRVVLRARHEAVRAGRDRLGCEHLLLGLLAEPGPAASAMTEAGLELAALRARLLAGGRAEPDPLDADALASVGIDLDTVRRATDAMFGPGALDRAGHGRARRPGRLRVTADAKQALGLALDAAVKLRQKEISGGHLLIGIIDQGDNGALGLLAAFAVDTPGLRADVVSRLAAAA